MASVPLILLPLLLKASPLTPVLLIVTLMGSGLASLLVVLMPGMTNANDRILCNGLNPMVWQATQMAVEEEMARCLDYWSYSVGHNNPIDVDNEHPNQSSPPPLLPPPPLANQLATNESISWTKTEHHNQTKD
jgi:hypothetical protein